MVLLILIILYEIASHQTHQGEITMYWLFLYCGNVVLFTIASIVYFNQSNYTVNEKNGVVKPVLVLTSLVSIDLSVEVKSKNMTAKGEYLAK